MAEVRIGVEGATGIVTLNRPRAINALTTPMVEAVRDALAGWARDRSIRAVLIEGEGEKGLCAGGDVRAVREHILAGRTGEAFGFFSAEYEMNGLIATYAKPVIALQTGIVMGGGIGLSSHARYRVCTPETSFAMPEAAIGFFSDVGVNSILALAPRARALAFLLSGIPVASGDAIALGLSDAAVAGTAMADIRGRLIEAARAGEPDVAIAAILQAESIEPGPADFCALADSLAPAFSEPDMAGLLDHVASLGDEGDPGAAALCEKLERHCPTSLAVIFESHLMARRQRDVAAVLETDLALARFVAARDDFAEGVRAVLVDRDKAPRWSPDRLAAVDYAAIRAVLGQPGAIGDGRTMVRDS